MLHAQGWRLASALDSLRFKFVENQDYWGCVGHKWWSASGTAGKTAPTNSGDSGMVSFRFDGAYATTLGLSVVATALAFF